MNKIKNDTEEHKGNKLVCGNLAPFVSILSEGQILNGNNDFDFDFSNIDEVERIADLGKDATLFICNDGSDSVKSSISFLEKRGFSLIEKNDLYYILKWGAQIDDFQPVQ